MTHVHQELGEDYFYITNWLTSEKISRAIYTPIKTTKSHYLTKAIHGEQIDINKIGVEQNEQY